MEKHGKLEIFGKLFLPEKLGNSYGILTGLGKLLKKTDNFASILQVSTIDKQYI